MNFSVLRIKSFRCLWLGQAVSQLGDSFYYVTFMFMVKKLTGSSAMVGYVGALESLPFLLFGAYAGVVADRIDRRLIMLASDLASGGCLLAFGATIFFTGKPQVWALLAMPFLLSTVRCFFMPAKSASIPALVPSESVLNANAVSSTTQTAMPLLGLGLSACVMAAIYAFSPKWFLFSTVCVNSVSFLVSAAFIARLPAIRPYRNEQHETHPFADFKEGIRYIKNRHDLVVLTVLLTVFRLMVAPFFVVYLAANDKWFNGKPQNIVWWEFSFFSGMVISSVAMGKARPKRPLQWFCVGLAIVGLGVGAMAFSRSFWLFVLWNLLCGLALPPADIPIATYLQLSVPDGFRGRVNAVREMISTGIMPIGMMAGGLLVDRFGVFTGFLVMGLGMFICCCIGLLDKPFRAAAMPG